jgi:DNA-binding protein H-NS
MMAAALNPLQQKAELAARIAEMLKTAKGGAVEEVRVLVQECRQTKEVVLPVSSPQDEELRGQARIPRLRGGCGLGRQRQAANWLNGKNCKKFLIERAKS